MTTGLVAATARRSEVSEWAGVWPDPGGGRNMLAFLSTGWLRLGTGDHREDVDRARTPAGWAGARGEMCPEGPLLENQKLGQLQTGTHHLRAADGVESARDSTSATRPDVVLKLMGLGSTPLRLCSGRSPLQPRPGQSPRKGSWTHPTGLCTLRPDKAQQGAPKAAGHPHTHAHTHTCKLSHVCA